MLRYVKLICITSFACALSSCSYFGSDTLIQDRGTDYLKAKSIPPLRVPAGLSSSHIQAHYPVSDLDYPESAKKVDLTPPELSPAPVRVAPVQAPDPTLTPEERKEQATYNSYYYDPYTRSSSGKAGTPMSQVIRNLWPWGNKKKTATTTVTTGTKDAPVPAGAATTQAQPAPVTSSNSTAKALQPSASEKTPVQEAQNNAGNQDDSNSKMRNYYFDRYSQR